MPKIPAYKGNNVLIPVDAAQIGTAYQCPWTNRLFATKPAYVKHLRELRTNRMHRAAHNRVKHRKLAELWNLTGWDEITEWVELNSKFIFDCLEGHVCNKKHIEKIRNQFKVSISFLDVVYCDRVSNSHSCPHNGVTNWCRSKKGAPSGYPGWSGRIEFSMKPYVNGISGSDIGRLLRLHTGTGGGTTRGTYGYSVSIFADDWPGLDQRMVMKKLECGEFKDIYISGSPDYFRKISKQ